jgi:hypothetical protein
VFSGSKLRDPQPPPAHYANAVPGAAIYLIVTQKHRVRHEAVNVAVLQMSINASSVCDALHCSDDICMVFWKYLCR